ncbi:alpha/beta hydrolase [Metallibacterium scheffleri]|uniref:Alpha/beta hydrolase n=1 Tax=Metallibacterium scheffleri TaxID=993689 RepID=A0A4S3KQJ7_9GAMM|nr:alpha/beta hydrolase [Metallibacterium scheffleri]THD11269.1 alpha/beta hydrolase [Metallibacterium scheffleri]
MTPLSKDSIPALLVHDLPRELVMGVEDAFNMGALRAYDSSRMMADGHLAHVLGQQRHFEMNEAFHKALQAADARPSPIRGNDIITGRAGIFTVGRFNIPTGFWINGRRSHTRRQMSLVNKALVPLLQPSLFEQYSRPSNAVVFFVACFSGSVRVHPHGPVSINIAVPDDEMRGWLFREPLSVFLQRYEPIVSESQLDLAKPKLKKGRDSASDGGQA